MKRILLCTAFILSSIILLAQQSLEDVVYLKSGKIVRGRIIEQNTESITILLVGKYKFTYQQIEIEKITKEVSTSTITPSTRNRTTSDVLPIKEYDQVNEDRTPSAKGYIGIIEFGYGIPVGDFGMNYLKVNFINGYRFNQNVSLGLGLGLHQFNDSEQYDYYDSYVPDLFDNKFIPIFLDLRVNLTKGKISPYLVLDAGANFYNDFSGSGVMYSPGAGVKFGIGPKSSLNVGISFDNYQIPFFDFNSGYVEDYSRALGVNLSFTF